MHLQRLWKILRWSLLGLPLVLGFWLACSSSGLIALLGAAESLSAGHLQLKGVEGSLVGPVRLQEVLWTEQGSRLRLKQVELEWRLAELLQGRLHVLRLVVASLQRETLAPTPALSLPSSLRSPILLQADALEIGEILNDGRIMAGALKGVLSDDGQRYRLRGFSGQIGAVLAGGQVDMATGAPFALNGSVNLTGAFQAHAFALEVRADGSLADIVVAAEAKKGELQGSGQVRLSPFSSQAFSRLQLQFRGLNPAAWLKGAPLAALDVQALLEPGPGGKPAGRFTVDNRDAARLERGRLPLQKLAGHLAWQGSTALFEALQVELAGGGKLAGQGRLEAGSLSLDLQASNLDAAALHGRLQATRLAGSLNALLSAEQQALTLDLHQADYVLRGRLRRQGETLTAEDVDLRAGTARLAAAGRLTGSVFEAHGELSRFDPARFMKGVSGQLNGRFHGAGRLQPRPDFKLDFALEQSSLAGVALTGKGDVDVNWPAVRRADIKLDVGPNHLGLQGAFGNPGDKLALDIQAPQLADLGLAGDVAGTLHLAGTLQAPLLDGQLLSRKFAVPGQMHTEGMALRAALGAKPTDRLLLDIKLARLQVGEAAALASLSLLAEGSRQQHHIQAGARLPGKRHVELAAEGGLAADVRHPRWNGRVTSLNLYGASVNPLARLTQAAALAVDMAAWRLGPLALAAADWQGVLKANSQDGRLHAEASAMGRRYGNFSAAMDGAGVWSLQRDQPWRGELVFHLPDLTWVGPLWGEGLQSGGAVEGSLSLLGTPAHPMATGQAKGDKLMLVLAEQGLRLENGLLAASLKDNLLRMDKLAFDSRLPAPPKSVPSQAREEFAALAAKPGRLEVSGEMLLGAGGEGAFLDLRLERLGITQTAEQWLALSGKGRLDWRQGVLGITSQLKVDGGYWQLAPMGTPHLSDDVIVKSAKPAPKGLRLNLDVTTDLGALFYFNGAGLASRLAGSVHVQQQGRDMPKASGSIRTVGGKFDAYGQKLDIERGVINFQGLPDNPALNVRALRKGLAVEAGVEVTGTAQRPLVHLVSDPEVPEAEKLSWLVLGRDGSELGSGDAGLLLAAAGSILGGNGTGLVQRLKQGFGVDELGLRNGQVGTLGERSATSRVATLASAGTDSTASSQIVTVGKRISANTFLSYEQALGKADSLVKLTVQLSRYLSLVGRAGSDNALDLFYTWSFGK